ncbi:CHAT domain-containing protein [Mycena latifolia]|nr:CHAT domain-containing protein [Mycena latifolia]
MSTQLEKDSSPDASDALVLESTSKRITTMFGPGGLVVVEQTALGARPPNQDPVADRRAENLRDAAVACMVRYHRSGKQEDLEDGLQKFQEAVDLTLEGHPERAEHLQNLAGALGLRYRRFGELKDLDASLHNFQEAVDLTPEEHPNRAGFLANLAISLGDRYHRLGDITDLEAQLLRFQEVLDLTPAGHPEKARYLQALTGSFIDRYNRLKNVEDLEVALQKCQEVLDLVPEGHPSRAGCLATFATALSYQYKSSANLKDLEAAMQKYQEAVYLAPEGNAGNHPKSKYLRGLAECYTNRYQMLGNMEDLETALQKLKEAMSMIPDNHPSRAEYFQALAARIINRYEILGDPNDLDAALENVREALYLTPENHAGRAHLLWMFGSSFIHQYQKLGDSKDLEGAVQSFQTSVDIMPEGHSNKATYLQGLGVAFTERYRKLGDLKDLEDALQTNQNAVDLTPEGSPERPGRLRSLGISLEERYQRLGDLNDLETALQRKQEALDLVEGQPDRAGFLDSLAVSLRDKYSRLGDLKDLDMAIQNCEEAVELTPARDPSRAWHVQSLALSYRERYGRSRNLKDLEIAIQKSREAVDLTSEGHPYRPEFLQGLAVTFRDQYQRLGDLSSIEAAIQKSEESVSLTPVGHPEKAIRLQSLAVSFQHRYERLRQPADLKAVHDHYTISFELPSSTPELCWINALAWGSFSERFQPSDVPTAYTSAFRLLPEILWIGHAIPVRQDTIRRLAIGQATSTAARACINLSDLKSAIVIMEQGLATIFQQMLQLKTDVDRLQPEDAENFKRLSAELYTGTHSSHMDTVDQRNKLLQNIRQQPGLEHFLRPKPYNVLSLASQGGPVVILNSHKDCCDGIIILNPTSKPVHVALPNVKLDQLELQQILLKELLEMCSVRTRRDAASTRLFGQQEQFRTRSSEESFADILAWLWSHVVSPVYQLLESHGIADGRLWWLPTGAFTGLPLHACPPTEQFIHSYTSTLGALVDANLKVACNTSPKLGVVGVTHTSSGRMNFLQGVGQEVGKIVSRVGKSNVECLQGVHATVDAGKLLLQDCPWVHLACHGKQDIVNPTKSHLMLYNGTLELETILRMPLSKAEFVFLAACQTAMGDAALINESFHLGGGFITAGFRGAIGTMWSMNDKDGPVVAEIVYTHLFRGGQQPNASDAAEALQLAVKELKARKVSYERWIPFIHMGV